MARISITVPFALDLTNENSWEKLGRHRFRVVRCHFEIRDRILNEPHKVGEALAVYRSPKGVGIQHVTSSTFELEEVNRKKSITRFLSEYHSVREFAENFSAHVGLSRFGVSANVRRQLSNKLRQEMLSQVEVSESSKVRETLSFMIENTIDPDITEPIVAVPAFKRKAFDLFLTYVDHLDVSYERSLWGLRRKAKKYPQIVDFNKHPNVCKIGAPLATIYYWEFLPRSCVLKLEEDHEVQVYDFEKMKISEPVIERHDKAFSFPKVPTLYQIANAAFPLKWILRRPVSREWTEEDLERL